MLPKKLLKHNPKLFAKGRRGLIFTVKINKKITAIKTKNPDSKAVNRIQNEVNFLKVLNKYKIGPKLLSHGKDYFTYEFVNGETLKEYMKQNKLAKKLLMNIMKQCEIMDKLGITKEEMHKPLKNIIIKNKKPILIDFERCHYTKRPKNANQFKQFLRRIKKQGLYTN